VSLGKAGTATNSKCRNWSQSPFAASGQNGDLLKRAVLDAIHRIQASSITDEGAFRNKLAAARIKIWSGGNVAPVPGVLV